MKQRLKPLLSRHTGAVVLLLLCSAGWSSASRSAHWSDRLPADDPATVPQRQGTLFPAATGPPPAPAASPGYGNGPSGVGGGPLSDAYGLTVQVLWSAVGAVQSVSSGTREALWETAYMFGINGTPVPHPSVVDDVTDIDPAPTEAPAVPLVSKQPEAAAVRVASAAPNGPIATDPPPAPAFSPAPRDAPPEPARWATIDPGLLANFIYDRGVRRADGSFFVPKPLQRLFEVRTQRVELAEVPLMISLAGRIVADPQNRGDVETSLMGRIEPPEGGLPVLGQTVHAGDILAYIAPAVGVVDRTQVRSEVAKLTTDIRIETENLEILKQFSFVPFRDGKMYQSEQRIAGMRRQREALLPLLQTREVLRASVDGVISTSSAIAGRIVHPGEAVFTIVNPEKLWIEALAPDPAIAENAARVRRASATTPEGQTLALTFVGSGLAQKEQSTPVLFRIDAPPAGLRVGRPVTVSVQSESRSQRGLPITRDALTIGSDGVQEVWEQSEPEVFLPHVVRTVELDGRSVVVVDGLKEGARVVVAGVRLLAQLQ